MRMTSQIWTKGMLNEIPLIMSRVEDGVSISGLDCGVCRVSAEYMAEILRMSIDGGLYPYRIISAVERLDDRSEWIVVFGED